MRKSPVVLYVGLGANLGDRRANILRAIDLLKERVAIDRVSSLYESPPVGFQEQPPFLNAVCRGLSLLEPQELLEITQGIEASMGRVRTFPNAPRLIDIDILLYGNEVIARPALAIPHPRIAERAFVLVPLVEISAGLRHPVLWKTMRELLEKVEGADTVLPFLQVEASRTSGRGGDDSPADSRPPVT